MASSKVEKTEDEWREDLTPDQYRVLRHADTEAPFSGDHWNRKEDGSYYCAGCGELLFTAQGKFESHCGWPSFWEAVDDSKIINREDLSHNMRRTETLCGTCGGHLGHLFNDGPKPGGKRYCINSVSLTFKPAEE